MQNNTLVRSVDLIFECQPAIIKGLECRGELRRRVHPEIIVSSNIMYKWRQSGKWEEKIVDVVALEHCAKICGVNKAFLHYRAILVEGLIYEIVQDSRRLATVTYNARCDVNTSPYDVSIKRKGKRFKL